MNNGRFITLEGGEGVGKSTNLQFIHEFLQARHIPLVITREPGGTAIAEQIRSILLQPHDEPLCEQAELLLIFAARAQHIQQVIQPALQRGCWVLSDRFTDATYAYQGGGRGMNLQTLAWLEDAVQGQLRPDMTFLFDAPVELGLQRAKARGDLDRFEVERQDFFQRVRSAYHQRADSEPARFRIIDASLALPEVQSQLERHLQGLLES